MNAHRDPWTDEEIKKAITDGLETNEPPIDLLVHLISVAQRATVALETIIEQRAEQKKLMQ